MKKMIAGTLAVFLLTGGVAFANLDDDKETITAQYGDYRLIIDTDNQLWSKAEWESRGAERAKADSYMYSFTREGLRTQMEVKFANNGLVRAQRFTPDMTVKIKDFQLYYPEIYQLIVSSRAQAFVSDKQLTGQFQERLSPITMGVVVKEIPPGAKGAYFTLLAFNIQDEGRLIKDSKFIDENTEIREFTIERISRTITNESFDSGEWRELENFFDK